MSSKPLSNFLKASPSGAMPNVVNDLYQFGEFLLDVPRRVLLHRLEPVPLTPKVYEMLLVLVRNAGQIVTKDALMKAVWPNSFVEESNLTQNVFMLRKALGETPERRYILTIPGTGYRFAAEVKHLPGKGGTAVERPAASPRSEVLPASRFRLRFWPVVIGIVIVLSTALAAHLAWLRSGTKAQPPGGRLMLAILPFDNLTGDAGQDYLTDGLTEELITQLGRLDPQRLGVIALTSVMHYKHGGVQLDHIGRQLGVQFALEGSVRREAGEVRVSAQLIQIKDQTHLWAKEYDRELSSLLVLQREIAQEVAEEIRLTLGDHPRVEPAQPTPLPRESYEAYDFYLKGRYFWNKRTSQSFQQAITCFQQAIAKDPKYARAYSGLADSYALLSGYTQTPQTESMPKARAAALKALELDEGLAEAHTSLALVAENYDWDWQTAEKEYRRAIELNPSYATAHHWYAEYLSLQGRFDEASAESERARQLDPLSLIIASDNGAILYYSRQYDRAIAQFRTVLEMEPDFPRAHLVVAAYIEKAQFADALADIEKWGGTESAPWAWSWRAHGYGRSGQRAQARHAMEKLQGLYRRQHIGPDPMLWAYVGMGDTDEAFTWFEKAYAAHSNLLTSLKVNPAYDPLRGDPRFQRLLRRVGLDQ